MKKRWRQSFAQAENKEYYPLANHDGEAVFQYSAPPLRRRDLPVLSYTKGTVSGCLSIHLPVQHVLDSLRQGKMQLFISALALIVLTVMTLYLLVRYLVLNPLGTLETVADGISRGQFPKEIRIGGNDERGRVGQALRVMSDKLEEGRNRLEEKVQSATTEPWRYGVGPGHLQPDRARPRRTHLGRRQPRRRQRLHLHPAGGKRNRYPKIISK